MRRPSPFIQHGCSFLAITAILSCTPKICAFHTHSKSRFATIQSLSPPTTTLLFSSPATKSAEQPKSSKLDPDKLREAREETRNLRSLFKTPDEDNTNSRPSITTLTTEQLRQLRREIIGRRRRRQNELDDAIRDRQDYAFIFIALVPCLLAFWSWEDLSRSLAQWLTYNSAMGKAVDGNKFASDLLRPTITGVVVPVISIALATLVSTTVNVLRARQVDIRALINKEACDLRLLRRAIFGMFGTKQHSARRSRALRLMKRYVDQIERECNAGAIENLQVLELSGGIATNELDELSAMLHGIDGAAASRESSVGIADGIIARLNSNRSDRVALLLTDFPDLHWIVLAALSVSICLTFLLESNQLVNQYLNSIQLRALFALLVGVFSATATLCIDLADPFSGTFSVAGTSAQVGDLRLCLLEDVREAKSDASELSSFKLRSLSNGNGNRKSKSMDSPSPQSNVSPSRYGNSFVSTVYFHLLTGPLGSNVRAIGEVLAWTAMVVWKKTKSLLSWTRRKFSLAKQEAESK